MYMLIEHGAIVDQICCQSSLSLMLHRSFFPRKHVLCDDWSYLLVSKVGYQFEREKFTVADVLKKRKLAFQIIISEGGGEPMYYKRKSSEAEA